MTTDEIYVNLIGKIKEKLRNTVVVPGVCYVNGTLHKSPNHYNVVYTDPRTRVQYWYNRHQKLIHVVRFL